MAIRIEIQPNALQEWQKQLIGCPSPHAAALWIGYDTDGCGCAVNGVIVVRWTPDRTTLPRPTTWAEAIVKLPAQPIERAENATESSERNGNFTAASERNGNFTAASERNENTEITSVLIEKTDKTSEKIDEKILAHSVNHWPVIPPSVLYEPRSEWVFDEIMRLDFEPTSKRFQLRSDNQIFCM